MRVLAISGMEGAAGIGKWEQTTGGEPLYEEGRRHGAGKGWTFNALVPEDLHPRASTSCGRSGRSA